MLTESHLKKLNEYLVRDTDAALQLEAFIKKADELAGAKAQFQKMMEDLFRLDGLAKEIKHTPPERMIQILRGDAEMSTSADFAVASWTGNIWGAIDRLTKALNEAGYLRTTTLTSFSAPAAEAEVKNWTRPTGA